MAACLALEGRTLVLTGDLAKGWRQFSKGGYGFCESSTLDLKEDWRVRGQLMIEAFRSHNSPHRESWPTELSGRVQGQTFFALVRESVVLVDSDLVKAAAHIVGPSQKRGIFENALHIGWANGLQYMLSLWVIFTPPPSKRPGDIREWNLLPFLAGGLPETNRRRF